MCEFCEKLPDCTIVEAQRSDVCAEPPEQFQRVNVPQDHELEIYGRFRKDYIHFDYIHLAWIEWMDEDPVLNVAEGGEGPSTMLIKFCPMCGRKLTQEKPC